MNVKRRLPLLIVAISTACTLNSKQETSLNQHVSKYLSAKNGCMVVGLVGFTYPEYVRELKSQGDSVLLQAIDCSESYEKGIYYTDPTLRKIKKENTNIHIYYELDIEHGNSEKIERRAKGLYAISEDNGKSWYFLEKEIYNNEKLCKSLNRLIDK